MRAARPVKGASAFRTIGEVAEDLDLPAHVLRFWESKFPQLKPLKRGGGRRYYRPEDVVLLRRIRQCLYQDGYTIRGVQQLLGRAASHRVTRIDREQSPSLFPLEDTGGSGTMPDELPDEMASAPADAPAELPLGLSAPPRRPRRAPIAPEARAALEEVRRELLDARALLDNLLHPRKTP